MFVIKTGFIFFKCGRDKCGSFSFLSRQLFKMVSFLCHFIDKNSNKKDNYFQFSGAIATYLVILIQFQNTSG